MKLEIAFNIFELEVIKNLAPIQNTTKKPWNNCFNPDEHQNVAQIENTTETRWDDCFNPDEHPGGPGAPCSVHGGCDKHQGLVGLL